MSTEHGRIWTKTDLKKKKKKLETIQMLTNRNIDPQNVVYSYNETLHRNKKE